MSKETDKLLKSIGRDNLVILSEYLDLKITNIRGMLETAPLDGVNNLQGRVKELKTMKSEVEVLTTIK